MFGEGELEKGRKDEDGEGTVEKGKEFGEERERGEEWGLGSELVE